MARLTRRQRAYLDWITWYWQKHRRGPLYREIAKGMRRSTTAVFAAVLALTEKCYVDQYLGRYGTTRPAQK